MKTLAMIAAAGLASTAMARVDVGGHLGQDFGSMTSIDGLARGTTNFTTDVNVDGTTTHGVLGTPANMVFTINIGAFNEVSSVGFDIDIQTSTSSWLSEVTFNFNDSTGMNANAFNLTPAPGDGMGTGVNDQPGMGNFSSGGLIDLTDAGLPGNLQVGADGLLVIEVFEAFDDPGEDPDAFVDGTITLGLVDVPAPGAAALFGLGGLAAARRRR